MGKEIERKFLIQGELPPNSKYTTIRQGYLQTDKERTVRIRTITMDNTTRGYLTIKGLGSASGMSRYEFEMEIPPEDATHLLTLCDQPLIEKTRYRITHANNTWEVDIFLGANQGLAVAEIELEAEDQVFDKPDFIGAEITGDIKYYNSMLQKEPYTIWKK
ncbi:MAG: CYTH domain-containing protein [Candidatus Marinimicrobia bacterium]|nr:CYTH domain-containing protein [Candidatus Neomarinimicrobiota bacterium]